MNHIFEKVQTAVTSATDDYPIITSIIAASVATVGGMIDEYKPILGDVAIIAGSITAIMVCLRQAFLLLMTGRKWWDQSSLNPRRKEIKENSKEEES